MIRSRRVVMVGPDVGARGGMASVVEVYRAGGLFDAWGVTYLTTHSEGGLAHKLWVACSALARLVLLLAKGGVGLLHAHVAERTSFRRKAVLMLAALCFRRPFVFHLHSGWFLEFYRTELGALGRWTCRLLLRRAAAVVVVATPWESAVRTICPGANVVRIPNPVRFDPAAATAPSRRDPATLLFLGRLGEAKGIYDLLEAVALLRDELPGLVLQAGGDGERDEVRARAAALGVADRVQVPGWIVGAQKDALLARATLYVQPSHVEALGMGILEALATGLPVVATDVGGIPDAVRPGVEGLLVPAGDVRALSAAIRTLLGDFALREQFSAAAVERVRTTFAADAVIARIGALYGELLARPSGARPAR